MDDSAWCVCVLMYTCVPIAVDRSMVTQTSHMAAQSKHRMKFISSKENLKTIMLLLRDKSAAIQFEVCASCVAAQLLPSWLPFPKRPTNTR